MEVTQFTYFQEVGSLACKPVLGEITYGLERLAMYLQGVENVFDLVWTTGVTYGDVYHQNEVEQSKYNFEECDPKWLFGLFDGFEREAKRLLERGLTLPGYEMVMKCSHAFNLLDARGAISITERAAYIGRVRALARAAAQAYYESRERLGFPMLQGHREHAPLLVELLTEELPPKALRTLGYAFADALVASLRTDGFAPAAGEFGVYATPRRARCARARCRREGAGPAK